MNNTGKAPEEALNNLHAKLAEVLKSAIQEDGSNAAILNVARQFLKDNGVAIAADPGDPLSALSAALPYPGQPDPDPSYGTMN